MRPALPRRAQKDAASSHATDLNGINHRYGDMPVLSDIERSRRARSSASSARPGAENRHYYVDRRLEQPDEGAVLAHGTAPADSLNPLTYIFQISPAAQRSVAGNVSLVLEDHGLGTAKIEAITDDVLARTKLLTQNGPPRQLSAE